MSPRIAQQIQIEQDHGRQKYGQGIDDFTHDDRTPESAWHDYIQDHNEQGRTDCPMDRRQRLIKIAGLAVSAIEAFERNNGFKGEAKPVNGEEKE